MPSEGIFASFKSQTSSLKIFELKRSSSWSYKNAQTSFKVEVNFQLKS